jgi:Holliday junction resolvasome RuvABC endonuclease subunit
MRKTPETILALDPGLRELGYAVLAGRRLAASGVLNLRELPRPRRLAAARGHVQRWAHAYQPHAIVVEKTYPHPLPWLDRLHTLTRGVRRIASSRNAAFAAYAPQTVRKGLVGNGWAKKPEVAVAVAHRFPQLRVHLTQDRRWKERYWQNMFDAVALAIHYQRSQHPPSRGR